MPRAYNGWPAQPGPETYISSSGAVNGMRTIHLFYAGSSEECRETRAVLEHVVDREDDVLLVAHDVETEAGRRRAVDGNISTVPTTVVDGTRVIRGVPHSPEQVLGDGSGR